MMRNFLFSSLFLCLLFASCSKANYPARPDYSPIVSVGNEVEKYDMKLDFARTHLSGILVVRQMESGEVRMIATTPFGLSLFDFGIHDDQWQVYSCIEPMRKKKVLKIFEEDFKTLFAPNRKVNKVKQKKDYTEYINGNGITRSVTRIWDGDRKEKIRIAHSWIRLFIHLEKMEKHVTE